MSSKYTHCYSNYVNHILNASPTKVTYTFPKEQRFSPQRKEVNTPVDAVLQKAYLSSTKKLNNQSLRQQANSNKKLINNYTEINKQPPLRYNLTSNKKKQIEKSRSKSRTKQIYPFQKYLNNGIIRTDEGKRVQRSKSSKAVRFQNDLRVPAPFNLESNHKKNNKVWNKGQSPDKSERKRLYTQIEHPDNLNKSNHVTTRVIPSDHDNPTNKYLKYSPYYRQYMANNEQDNFLSRQQPKRWKLDSSSKQRKDHKKTKTVTMILEQIDHPSKHITVQGYYPVGKQINPKGKYTPSNYRNVPVHSFGKSPTKKEKRKRSQQQNRYHHTPNKNNTLLPNGAELYPQVGSYYRHFTDKKVCEKQTRKNQEFFVPFSQFGDVNHFRY